MTEPVKRPSIAGLVQCQERPWTRPRVREKRVAILRIAPKMSILADSFSSWRLKQIRQMIKEIIIKGRLTRKIHRQPKYWVRMPPIVGPRAAARPWVTPRAAMILVRAETLTVLIPKVIERGKTRAAPRLWIARPTIKKLRSWLIAERREPSIKVVKPKR